MLDDAAFYAANSLVSDRFLLTTAFNVLIHTAIEIEHRDPQKGAGSAENGAFLSLILGLLTRKAKKLPAEPEHSCVLTSRWRRFPAIKQTSMIEPRLSAEMIVQSLLRKVNQEGGFGVGPAQRRPNLWCDPDNMPRKG